MAKTHWCLAIVDELPECISDGLCLTVGFPEGYEPSESSDFQYLLLCRAVAGSFDIAQAAIVRCLAELELKSNVIVEPFCDQVSSMIRSERFVARSMQMNDASVFERFIGFKKNDTQASATAKSIIRQAVHRKKWQFWR